MLSDSPYDLLLHATGPESRVLWCWFPRSKNWTETELIERSTRAISAVRNDDLIALPELHAVRIHASHWCDSHDLRSSQVLWYDPMLHPSEFSMCLDPAHAALLAVLVQVPSSLPKRPVCMHHMYLDKHVVETAASFGISCLGDPDEHPMLGSLSKAKICLHPNIDINPHMAFPIQLSLGDANLGDDIVIPRGFISYTADHLREAWSNLNKQDPEMRLVLKPAAGSGGAGVVLNVTEAEVQRAAWMLPPVYRVGLAATILEEMIGEAGGVLLTVSLVGTKPFAVAEKLLVENGAINAGNVMPAVFVGPATRETMLRAASALGAHLGLTGQWELDFALRASDGTPVMCDLRCGRPNGSLSYYCWRSRQPRPNWLVGVEGDVFLALTCISWNTPKTRVPLGAFVADLKARRMLWDEQRGDGVVLAQYMPGRPSSVLVASWKGSSAAKKLLKAFQAIYMSSPGPPDIAATATPKIVAAAVAAAAITATAVAAAAAVSVDHGPVIRSVVARSLATNAGVLVDAIDLPPPFLTRVGVVAAVPAVVVAAPVATRAAQVNSFVASATTVLCSTELSASAAITSTVSGPATLIALASAAIAIARPCSKKQRAT